MDYDTNDFAINFIGEASETNENGEVVKAYPEIVEKLETLKAQLAKRNAGERKPTKTQVANENVKAEILTFLANGEKHTATEIMTAVGIESNQKATALLKQLKEAELITREEIKRKAYFAIA